MGNKPNCEKKEMLKMKMPFEWMNVKYGQPLQPYECVIKFDNTEGSDHGQFKATEDQILHYFYRVIYDTTN